MVLLAIFVLIPVPIAVIVRRAFEFAMREEHFLTTTPPRTFFLQRLRKPAIIWGGIWLVAFLGFMILTLQQMTRGLSQTPLYYRAACVTTYFGGPTSILLTAIALSILLVRRFPFWVYASVVTILSYCLPLGLFLGLMWGLPAPLRSVTYSHVIAEPASGTGTSTALQSTHIAFVYVFPLALAAFLLAASRVRNGSLFRRRS